MENAVVYARYSSHSQTEQSIEGQLSAAYKYARDHSYNIIKEYCDRAKSGTTDNRIEFQRMLSDCKKKKFTVIIVWKVDRFGRNREEITFNKYKCKKNGVRVEYVAENIVQGPEGVILESVLEGMAEYYSLQLSQNVQRGYLESAKKHHVIGVAPLGYCRDTDKTYKIVPEEAKVVRLLFDKYNSGMSQRELIDFLNTSGYSHRGKPFTKSTIQRILNDERYIGTFTYKDIIREENIIEPIVDKAVFYACRSAKTSWSYNEYKLSRYLWCKCGNKMKGSSGYNKNHIKYNYYICPKCKKTHVRADKLEVAVFEEVYKILSDTNIIDEIANELYNYYKEKEIDRTEEEILEAELLETEKKLRNLVKSIENGINPEFIVPRINELETQRDNITLSLSKIAIERPFEVSVETVRTFLSSVSPDVFISKIVVSDKNIILALNCMDTETVIDCSTMIQQMALADHQTNILYYKTWLLVKKFL